MLSILEAKSIQAVRGAMASGRPPMLLLYHPNYSRNNPYQTLIYRRFSETGIGVVPLDDPADTLPLTSLTKLGAAVILHLHWTNWVLRDVETEKEAEGRVDCIAEWLAELGARGIKIVWTIHNVLPHDMAFPESEKRLQQCIADNADVTHIMTESTLLALRGVTEVTTDKVLVIPHPNYIGAYADYYTKPQARAALGIDPEDVAYQYSRTS